MRNMPTVFLWLQTGNAFGRGLAQGIATYSRIRGPWSFFRMPPYYRLHFDEDILLPSKPEVKVDGIIAYVDSPEQASRIKTSKIPAIVIYVIDPIPGLINVITHGESIGIVAAEHLLERGLKHFAFCGYDDIHWSHSRAQGFINTIRKAGYDVDVYRQPNSPSKLTWEREQCMMSEWLKTLPKPVGLMACNDNRSLDVTEACKICKIRIPEQIAVIGVDNDSTICELSDPPLSSIPLNTASAGYHAAELLDTLMNGKKTTVDEIFVYPQTVVVRQSTDMMAIENDNVALAINYIRQNSKSPLQVLDVADAVGVSLRKLQLDFAMVLGRSISEEIKSVRVKHIASILTDTDLPISQIANEFGYSNFANLARYFRKQMGMTLKEYRKKHSVRFKNMFHQNTKGED